MQQSQLPDWESLLIDEAIASAKERFAQEEQKATRRALQLAREQAYHRLAVEIDRPKPEAKRYPGQLSFFPSDPTLFDEPA